MGIEKQVTFKSETIVVLSWGFSNVHEVQSSYCCSTDSNDWQARS